MSSIVDGKNDHPNSWPALEKMKWRNPVMKRKKTSVLLTVGALVLSFASSALASPPSPQLSEPQNQTLACTPMPGYLRPDHSWSCSSRFAGLGYSFITTISSPTETDWFDWTNDTGVSRWVYLYFDFVNPTDRYLDYLIGFDQYDLFGPVPPPTIITNETGRKQLGIYMTANSTLRINVAPQQNPTVYNPNAQYEIVLLSNPRS